MVALSEQAQKVGKTYFIDASSETLPRMFDTFWKPFTIPKGLLRLNISDAKKLGDYGITLAARASPNLIVLNISGCTGITDNGLREVGLNCTQIQELLMSR